MILNLLKIYDHYFIFLTPSDDIIILDFLNASNFSLPPMFLFSSPSVKLQVCTYYTHLHEFFIPNFLYLHHGLF